MDKEKEILINNTKAYSDKKLDIILKANSLETIKQIEKLYINKYNKPTSKFLIILTEIIQNIIKHSESGKSGYIGIIFNKSSINLYAINKISEENIYKLKKEIALIMGSDKFKLKQIMKKRIMNLKLAGTGLIQIFLKSGKSTQSRTSAVQCPN